MKKNKKILFVLVVSLLLVYILISILMSMPKGKKFKNTVFVGSSTKIEIKNGNIKIYNEDVAIDNIKVKIYFKGKFVDGYISSGTGESSGVENIYYVYNENGDYLLPETTLIAHTKDISIKIKDGLKIDADQTEEINKFLTFIKEIPENEFDIDYMNTHLIDIDEDGHDEYIYSFGLVEDNSKYKSYAFVKKDDNYVLIDSVESGLSDIKKIIFTNLIDVDSDGKYEVMLDKIMGEYGPFYYELYSFDGNTFTKLGGE